MATKPPVLDMFRRVLPGIDTRDRELYNRFSDEERKGFGAWLIMRYMSSAENVDSGVIEHYLMMTNDIVNTNFSDVKDPEMMWKLMTIVGCGRTVKHPYVAPPKGKRKKESAFKSWLREHYPHLDDQELDIWIEGLDKKSARNLLEQFQVKDKDVISSANDL
jgi:hypothetical protein